MTDTDASCAELISEVDTVNINSTGIPIAIVNGQAMMDLPKNLYIPTDAMQVFIEAFEGPLDLLLYLIRKQHLNILDIPIAAVTQQYMKYIEFLKSTSFELATEYLVMAAILAEIKSRMLLPSPAIEEENTEEDPRAELVRRLQAYEQFKQAAEELDQLRRLERDNFLIEINTSQIVINKPAPRVALQDLVNAFIEVSHRVALYAHHSVQLETLSVREKMSFILSRMQYHEYSLFTECFSLQEGRVGVVVTFLAMLELLKQCLIEFTQTAAFAPIYLRRIQ